MQAARLGEGDDPITNTSLHLPSPVKFESSSRCRDLATNFIQKQNHRVDKPAHDLVVQSPYFRTSEKLEVGVRKTLVPKHR